MNVLTGFKYIGQQILGFETTGKGHYLFGFEESYGYLLGSYARDKDAVEAAMMILEMTAYYKAKGMTLCDALEGLYARYGYCYETNVEIYMEGLDGIERRRRLMAGLRECTPKAFGGVPVASVADHSARTVKNLLTGEEAPTGMTASDVLYYTLENGDIVVVRPSGTEPKIKVYVMTQGKDADEARANLTRYGQWVATLQKA